MYQPFTPSRALSRMSIAVLGVLLLASAGCGDSPATQPTPISPGSPQTPGAPTASFTITVDSAGSQEAITGVSEVTVDASASTGAGARFEVAFGDGDTAATSIARHVYRTAGSYTVTLTVTDDTGRKTTSTRQLVVASPLGRWVHSAYVERRKEVQVRTLVLTVQDGGTVRGALTREGNRTIAVTGTIGADRSVRLTLEDGSEVLEGQVPSVFSTAGSWPLTSRGSSIDGQSLTFARVTGEPAGAAPDAVLGMRFFSFGAPFAVKQISPVLFDGSNSRGEGLTYYLEFGDGQVATVASTTHPMEKEGNYVARLTVIDRFGRSDVESLTFLVRSLRASGYYNYWESTVYFGSTLLASAFLEITEQNGTAVTGVLSRGFPPERTSFTGTVNGDGSVELRLAGLPVTLTGTMTLAGLGEFDHRLVLTYRGGRYDGQTLRGYWRKGY